MPLPDEIAKGIPNVTNPIPPLINNAFRRNRGDVSPRLVISALKNGYRFLDLLTKLPPTKPGEKPRFVATQRPLPLDQLKGGVRRVPVLDAYRNPFLRLSKPQSPVLGRVLRQRAARFDKSELMNEVAEEWIPEAADEDRWERIVSEMLRHSGTGSTSASKKGQRGGGGKTLRAKKGEEKEQEPWKHWDLEQAVLDKRHHHHHHSGDPDQNQTYVRELIEFRMRLYEQIGADRAEIKARTEALWKIVQDETALARKEYHTWRRRERRHRKKFWERVNKMEDSQEEEKQKLIAEMEARRQAEHEKHIRGYTRMKERMRRGREQCNLRMSHLKRSQLGVERKRARDEAEGKVLPREVRVRKIYVGGEGKKPEEKKSMENRGQQQLGEQKQTDGTGR